MKRSLAGTGDTSDKTDISFDGLATQLIQQCLEQNEKDAVILLDNFVDEIGVDQFLIVYQPFRITDSQIGNNQQTITDNIIIDNASLVAFAIFKGWNQIATRLIQYHVDNDDSTLVTVNGKQMHLSILCLAVIINNKEMVRSLLTLDENLLQKPKQKGIFMHAKDLDLTKLLVEKAQEKKIIKELLFFKHGPHNFVLKNALTNENVVIIQHVLQYDGWRNTIPASELILILHSARLASWNQPEHYTTYNAMCLALRESIEKHRLRHKIVELKEDEFHLPYDMAYCYDEIFNTSYVIDNQNITKDEALNRIMAQFLIDMLNPIHTMKYLRYLDSKFNQFLTLINQSIKTVPKDSYDYQIIDGTYYPIPNDNFVGQTKKNALEKFLISLFKSVGLGESSYQWVGFIPHVIADQNVIEGDFIKESTFTPIGLLHGPLSHMIQQAILIYAIQNQEIDLSYQENGLTKAITLREIAEKFVSASATNNISFWATIRDARVFKKAFFIDPYRLFSIIMHDGEEYGLVTLSNYFKDSFCKNFLRLISLCDEGYGNIKSNTQFALELNDLKSNKFSFPSRLFQKAVDNMIAKGKKNATLDLQEKHRDNLSINKHQYALVERPYLSPSQPEFVHQPYQLAPMDNVPAGFINGFNYLAKILETETKLNLRYIFDIGLIDANALSTLQEKTDLESNILCFIDNVTTRIYQINFIDNGDPEDLFLVALMALTKSDFNLYENVFSHCTSSSSSTIQHTIDKQDFVNRMCHSFTSKFQHKFNFEFPTDMLNNIDLNKSIMENVYLFHLQNISNATTKTQIKEYIENNPSCLKWTKNGLMITGNKLPNTYLRNVDNDAILTPLINAITQTTAKKKGFNS